MILRKVNKQRLLFITRKYPPSVGGMEKVSYDLSSELSKIISTTIIAWGGSQKWLLYFLPKAFFQSLFFIPSKKITNIHLADGLLAPLGLVLKIITKRKVTITVHGLDITYKNRIYQATIPYCLSKLDKVICISSATKNECIKRGIPANKCTVIQWGVYPNEYNIKATRKALEKITGLELKNKKVLITVGRLVKRKGVSWFIENVMPKLESNYIFIVAGDGPERLDIQNVIQTLKLQDQVKMLGKVSDLDKKILYNTADVFVMPNIVVEGDMEGFGIVALEATSTGLPVVASHLEGIKDVVTNEQNGYLVKKPFEWCEKLTLAQKLNKNDVKSFVATRFSWSIIGEKYSQEVK
jgi:glycosyltransferase involved in cell wall biosynthesis